VFGASRNVYTLTAEGSTDGFERGYDAFLGDLFDLGVVTNNLSVTITLTDGAAAPELSTWARMLIGSWVLSLRAVVCRARTLRSQRKSLENTARGDDTTPSPNGVAASEFGCQRAPQRHRDIQRAMGR
jgi:hypothetical protein